MIQYFLDNFCKQGEEYLKAMCVSTVAKNIFLTQYKKFPSIETLPYNSKKDLWLEAKRLLPNKTPEEQKDAAILIYTVGNLL